jgi:hypothetical protein
VSSHRASNLATAVIARPVLFVIWIFVLWGTLYGCALAYATVVEGTGALRRALSGDDPLGGAVNLIAATVAIAVWTTVGALVFTKWARKR